MRSIDPFTAPRRAAAGRLASATIYSPETCYEVLRAVEDDEAHALRVLNEAAARCTSPGTLIRLGGRGLLGRLAR